MIDEDADRWQKALPIGNESRDCKIVSKPAGQHPPSRSNVFATDVAGQRHNAEAGDRRVLEGGHVVAQERGVRRLVSFTPRDRDQSCDQWDRQPPSRCLALKVNGGKILLPDVVHRANVLGHGRRQLLWLAVTRHPTAEWLAQQIVEAFPWGTAPTYLVRDNDGAYGPASLRANMCECRSNRRGTAPF